MCVLCSIRTVALGDVMAGPDAHTEHGGHAGRRVLPAVDPCPLLVADL